MTNTATTGYDVAEHLSTPGEMAGYLEACLEEADGDAAFIAKSLGDIVVLDEDVARVFPDSASVNAALRK